jgi:hypothetical protein
MQPGHHWNGWPKCNAYLAMALWLSGVQPTGWLSVANQRISWLGGWLLACGQPHSL